MKKRLFFHTIFALLLIMSYHLTFAHTINHDLEQMYGHGFLPLFIIAMLLPFAALGMLSAGHLRWHDRRMRYNHLFFILLLTGFMAGLFIHFHLQHALLDSLYVLLTGLFLFFLRSPGAPVIKWVLVPAGLSLGIEYALYIMHTQEFTWLYAGLFITGIIIYWALSRAKVIGQAKRKYMQFTIGIIFTLCGIVLLLLS